MLSLSNSVIKSLIKACLFGLFIFAISDKEILEFSGFIFKLS